MKISVFTPTLDRPEFIVRAATSVMLQTHEDWEWLVLDVGAEPIEHLLPSDWRIQYLHAPPAQGPAADFQRALELTTGEVVTPLADDDMIRRDALEIVATEIKGHDWLVAMTQLYDDDGKPWLTRGGTRESYEQTMAGEYMLGGAVYWRRELTERVGGFNPAFSGAADVDLYMRFGRDCEPRIIPDITYLYMDHPNTNSRLQAKNQGRQVRRIVG